VKLADNLTWLREHTGVHVHADLIVGLPGEDLQSFGQGFDRLVALRPQEIQVGMLKRLRGTPIMRHDAEWGMVYSPTPPYEILRTSSIDFATMQRLRRFSRYWDLIANSGNFIETPPLIWCLIPSTRPLPSEARDPESPFVSFLHLADWLFAQTGRQHGISLTHLSELLFRFLVEEKQLPANQVAAAIWADYQRVGRSDRPAFLNDLVEPADTRKNRAVRGNRQLKHLAR
jgi:hypothetical protein